MTNRLTIITTRLGDDGTTGLADGSRVCKTHPRVVAMGYVDELNSFLGLLLAQMKSASDSSGKLDDLIEILTPVQHALFDLGGALALPGHTALQDEQLLFLEQQTQQLNSVLPPLKEFVLPGGDAVAAQAHVVRSVCRSAERSVVEVSKTEIIDPVAQKYLNRLSDLLFVVARTINLKRQFSDVLWQR